MITSSTFRIEFASPDRRAHGASYGYPVILLSSHRVAHIGSRERADFVLPDPPDLVNYRNQNGRYRKLHGGDCPAVDEPPERIVDNSIFGMIRNPMYLGHLVFMAGLAIKFQS